MLHWLRMGAQAGEAAKLAHNHPEIIQRNFETALLLRSWGRDEMDPIANTNAKAWRCHELTNKSNAE